MPSTETHVFAVIRIDPEMSEIRNQFTVKEIVRTAGEAETEVARLNALRRGDSEYFWQMTRLVAVDK